MQNQMLETLGYKVNNRRYDSIKDIVEASTDYSKFQFNAAKDNSVVYSGAEHSPDDLSSKLPNLTWLPNLESEHDILVMGCTMGHHQDMLGPKRMQELYEFQGYGVMVIDNDNEPTVDLIIASPKDKVMVPNQCHMTIYNLGSSPLLTSDFANPSSASPNYNAANKDMQKKSTGGIGPIMAIYRHQNMITVAFNAAYLNSTNEQAIRYGSGVKKAGISDNELTLTFVACFDRELYQALQDSKNWFQNIGVNVKPASKAIELGAGKGEKLTTTESLVSLLLRPEKVLQRNFGMM